MNYYNVLLLSCDFALFVLVLMRLREIFQENQDKAIADMERHEQEVKEAKEKAIPDDVLAIFSEGGKTYEGWARQEDINKLKRIHVAAKQLIGCNQDNAVQLFAQLERAVNS